MKGGEGGGKKNGKKTCSSKDLCLGVACAQGSQSEWGKRGQPGREGAQNWGSHYNVCMGLGFLLEDFILGLVKAVSSLACAADQLYSEKGWEDDDKWLLGMPVVNHTWRG